MSNQAESAKLSFDGALSWGFCIEQAADCLGISIERMKALSRGKIGEFSIEQLMTMLTHAGMKLNVEILSEVA
jgi:predicted XRE-type DNA-binding protein